MIPDPRLTRTGVLCAIAIAACFSVTAVTASAQAPGEAVERLRAADTNHDGAVSRPELLAFRQTEWQRFDRNDDGAFTADDLPRFLRDRWNGGKLAQMRDSFDANKDGRITRAEFTSGPTPAFDMADTNNDARVTEAELKAATAAAKTARR